MLFLKLIVNGIVYANLSEFLVDFMMYSGVLQSNICFANCRKDSFFIRNWIGNQRKNDLKMIKISWNRFQIQWKIVQGTFWRPFAPLGVPKGSQTEFWEWKAGSLDPPWTPRWGPFFDFFSMQHSSDCLLDFWMHFGRILHPFWRPKCIQNGVRNGKCVFLVLSVSCRRELNLGGFGTPKSIKMTSENRLENWQVF